jgi:hypothetical protein
MIPCLLNENASRYRSARIADPTTTESAEFLQPTANC